MKDKLTELARQAKARVGVAAKEATEFVKAHAPTEEDLSRAKASLAQAGRTIGETAVEFGKEVAQSKPWGSIAGVTVADLQAFADAWNRHDADAIMGFMTDDCVFEASAGPQVCGLSYRGKDAVRAAFCDVWKTFPDARWHSPRHFVCDGRGVSEWTFAGTRADGTRVEVNGCDVFTFRDGKIAVKNSYRKMRPPLPAS